MLIREAGAGELEAVESLVKGAYLEYREQAPPELWEKWMESVGQAVHAGAGLLLVAEVAGAIKGVVQFFPDASRSGQGHWPAGSGTIRLLAVRGEARGQGLGTRLTRECLRRARAEAAHPLFIHRPLHAGGPAYL